jgi:hypothetical protein
MCDLKSSPINDYLNPDGGQCNNRLKDVYDLINGWRNDIKNIHTKHKPLINYVESNGNIIIKNFIDISNNIFSFINKTDILNAKSSNFVAWKVISEIENILNTNIQDGNGPDDNFGWYDTSSKSIKNLIDFFLLPIASPVTWNDASKASSNETDSENVIIPGYDPGLIQLIDNLNNAFNLQWKLFYTNFQQDNPNYYKTKFDTTIIDASNNILKKNIDDLNVILTNVINDGVILENTLNDLNVNIKYLNDFDSSSINENINLNNNYNTFLKNTINDYKTDTIINNKLLYDSIFLQNILLKKTVDEVNGKLNVDNRKGNNVLKYQTIFRDLSYYLYIFYYIAVFIFLIFLIFFQDSYSNEMKFFLFIFSISYPFLMIYIENIFYNFGNFFTSIIKGNVYKYNSIL